MIASPTPTEGWWASLTHGGLLIAPGPLLEHFPNRAEPLPAFVAERLRRDLTRLGDDVGPLLDTVLVRVAGLAEDDGGRWLSGLALGTAWTERALTGEAIRPRRVWTCGDVALPVFVPADRPARLGVGRGRRSVARVVEWLRRANRPIALVTNGRQWRLIWAGPEADAWTQWDTSLWFLEGEPGAQVTALRTLLNRRALMPGPDGIPPLLAAIQASRRGQAELSSLLGEQVRRAVETVIAACSTSLDRIEGDVAGRDVYIAATRMVMRLVVLFFAEARELLPVDDRIYHESYSLAGLREQLDRAGSGVGHERLRHRAGAWPRLLALFQLVQEGSAHEALPIPRYGGELFAPGDARSPEPVRRAVAAFESLDGCPSDAVVHEILDLLSRTPTRIRQGRTMREFATPVSFSDLSTEYLGILYEGLLDYELRRAGDEPVVFLGLGDQPALPLGRLEALDDRALAGLVAAAAQRQERGAEAAEDDAGQDEGEAEDDAESDSFDSAAVDDAAELPDDGDAERSLDVEDARDDERRAADRRAHEWALRAVRAARLVRPAGSSTASARAEREREVEAAASRLVAHTVLPGERYLVRWGGTRKGAGTFYTPPQLAVPTVTRTLRPLAYDPPEGGSEGTGASWTPKRPEEILALKVCDPAMGSGSFLVASLRFLADALFASLHRHGRIVERGSSTVVSLAQPEPGGVPELAEEIPVLPDAGDFEPRLRARLKRHVVEHCIYGVDIDPLAVELARLALWIETMDRELPFEFLDHRLKVGNSLVGCWINRVPDYPLLAWWRRGGDENHTGVHHPRATWGRSLAECRASVITPELAEEISGQLVLADAMSEVPSTAHDAAQAAIRAIERLPLHATDERQRLWSDRIANDPSVLRTRALLDEWCALWFWPADAIATVPTPRTFHRSSADTTRMVERLRREVGFFHWELEYPDVFTSARSGFDAILGNPPWETQKPNSKEFFSNIDPLYRTYGKQEALGRQQEMFRDADVESLWLAYLARFKQLANFVANVGSPFGDRDGGGSSVSLTRGGRSENVRLHAGWAARRGGRIGYAEPVHPYRYQGSADLNSYKLFLETAHALLRPGGRLGMLVPSGVYSDKGSTELRHLFLDFCAWEWLFGFENRDKIFDIHSSFKFCPIVVAKGGCTAEIQAAFMRRDTSEWGDAERFVLPYGREQILRFSPTTRALLEVGARRDLEVLDRVYANSVLLGDDGPQGWGVTYAREFDMTNDSRLFPPLPTWEARGYRPDPYGRWVGPEGDVVLPLYQGVMINAFDPAAAAWVSGAGNRAVWEQAPWDGRMPRPQFLMAKVDYLDSVSGRGAKVGFRLIARTTDQRTMIASTMPETPAGHSLGVLYLPRCFRAPVLSAALNSWPFDWSQRLRQVGVNLSYFIISESPLPPMGSCGTQQITTLSARLGMALPIYAPEWLGLQARGLVEGAWSSSWALTIHERLRLRTLIDAIVAALYGLDVESLHWILRECDYPIDQTSRNTFTRGLNPKGFWRVDKEKDPELRHTVLTMVAFADLQDCIAACGHDRERGIERFCTQNEGEGWMLPETVCLADYDLGHDDRARQAQPVRSRLGERFLPWQLEQTPEGSWAECERHARAVLGGDGFAGLQAELAAPHNGTRTPALLGSGDDPFAPDGPQETLFPDEGGVAQQGRLFP